MTSASVLAATAVALTVLAARQGVARRRSALALARLPRGTPATVGAARPAALPLPPPRWLVPRLDDAALPFGAAVAWTVWCAGGLALVVTGAVVSGVPLVVVAALGWITTAWLVLVLRRGASGRAVEEALPDAVEAVARSLRSGAGTHQALAEVASVTTGLLGVELRAATRDVEGGVPLEAALRSLEDRRPEPGVRLVVAALLLGAEAGGAHARALDGVAASIRSRLGVAREVRALSSQARLSAIVIGAAPLAFAVLAAGADSAGATFLLRTPLGLACLALGLALDAAGAVWMHRLAQVDG